MEITERNVKEGEKTWMPKGRILKSYSKIQDELSIDWNQNEKGGSVYF